MSFSSLQSTEFRTIAGLYGECTIFSELQERFQGLSLDGGATRHVARRAVVRLWPESGPHDGRVAWQGDPPLTPPEVRVLAAPEPGRPRERIGDGGPDAHADDGVLRPPRSGQGGRADGRYAGGAVQA